MVEVVEVVAAGFGVLGSSWELHCAISGTVKVPSVAADRALQGRGIASTALDADLQVGPACVGQAA